MKCNLSEASKYANNYGHFARKFSIEYTHWIQHTVSRVYSKERRKKMIERKEVCAWVCIFIFESNDGVSYLIALIHHLNKFKICVKMKTKFSMIQMDLPICLLNKCLWSGKCATLNLISHFPEYWTFGILFRTNFCFQFQIFFFALSTSFWNLLEHLSYSPNIV